MIEIADIAPGMRRRAPGYREGRWDPCRQRRRGARRYRLPVSRRRGTRHPQAADHRGDERGPSTLEKDPDDTLGLTVAPFPVKRCRNKCIFCFVDQMPPACRKSLYVKDDDFRASFLYGNYITLGALSEDDWQRIFHQRLSPLYVSVHATDPALRSFILGNKKAPDIMASMRRLAAGGIRMHAQIVLCPGVNDGPYPAEDPRRSFGSVPLRPLRSRRSGRADRLPERVCSRSGRFHGRRPAPLSTRRPGSGRNGKKGTARVSCLLPMNSTSRREFPCRPHHSTRTSPR